MLTTSSYKLPSLVRRCHNAYLLKVFIKGAGAELRRVGRSRNWVLLADTEQASNIIEYIEESNEKSWQWVAKALFTEIEVLSYEALLFLAKQQPNITIANLISKTNCTLAQARKVLDDLEDLN